MIGKVKKAVQLIGNMGWRYIFFRSAFEFKKRTGILKSKFPMQPKFKKQYTLESWRLKKPKFFIDSKETLNFQIPINQTLKDNYQDLADFKYTFFSGMKLNLGGNYDWITNPITNYQYDSTLHWLDINDYDPKVGDIKFVWEPSRFSHLYTIIRYDKQASVDCSGRVFSEIERWMDANPINQGPNFKCSQEISLRVMNWIFVLYYYQNSLNLSPNLFKRIQHYIYWQVEHVYHNINFSRIAVRNNHAITETLLLYIAGLLFPDFPNARRWKENGKKWFEKEIAYQIYEDGTFLQFSMNYHRVVVQLLTWALSISSIHKERFDPVVYERAEKSLRFLMSSMNENNGMLPNYGANDGALFFKLNDQEYRDYRPQLEALSYALNFKWEYDEFEDKFWYGNADAKLGKGITIADAHYGFPIGGYDVFRIADSLSFIRCGNHKDRPSQADNLHLDVWIKGKNILHDGGSYKYNALTADLKYFMGTQSHNTVMLDDYDQMEKGARFIWYNWTQCETKTVIETSDYFVFEGQISAFRHIDKSVSHQRKIKIYKNKSQWEIEDTIINKPEDIVLKQLWHTSYFDLLSFDSFDMLGQQVIPTVTEGYYSTYYGIKEKCDEVVFATTHNHISTTIAINK